jgi:large subunit ribosomal protein L23
MQTEKSMAHEHQGKYFFVVNRKASKGSIAKEVKRLYGVDVESVRTMIMPGKKRRVMGTRRFTKTKKWKKAIVKIKDGQQIEEIGA